jgi:uncharacterized protein
MKSSVPADAGSVPSNATYHGPIVDVGVFHEWASTDDLAPYLDPAWRELLIQPTERVGSLRMRSSPLYINPSGGKALSAYPLVGPAGSDFPTLKRQVLDNSQRKRLVLGYDEGLLTTAYPNHWASREIVKAVNDWTAEQWLARDERLFGLVLVVSAVPVVAADEIRRAGRNDRMVGVALGANGLGTPLGHPVYDPIYEAATEMNLPVVLQVGIDSAGTSVTPPMGGGLASTYAESRVHAGHPLMSHAANMIVQGVFERYPTLNVMLLGGGVSWIPGYLWRLNSMYNLDQREAPWLKGLPSQYFAKHFTVTTYTMEAPRRAEMLAKALGTLPWIDMRLMYASGYPNADGEEPAPVAARLPESWYARVFYENAMEFFRWPGQSGRDSQLAGLEVNR